jgi:membrane protease YdiL (CAAX protease family)
MNKPRFAERHPYWFVVRLALAYIAIFLLAGTVVSIMKWPVLAIYAGGSTGLALLGAALLTRFGWWREAGFRGPTNRRDLLLFWLPLLTVFGNMLGGFNPPDLRSIAIFLVLALLAGFGEEAVFRGLMVRVLAGQGLWRAAGVSSVVFGVSHLLNVLGGSDPAYVLLQICYAFAIGFAYAALVLRTGMVWPLVITHFLTDFVGFSVGGGITTTNVTTFMIVLSVVYVVAFTGYGIYLLGGMQKRLVQPVMANEPA